MFPETLPVKTFLVLRTLEKLPLIQDFYLAGGTALALQLGHRQSIDLDFFIKKLPLHQKILDNFKKEKLLLFPSDETGLNLELQGVKVSFLQYPYPLLEQIFEYDGVKLASVLDIACMKLNAIIQRGEKKDFYDLFEILKRYSLEEILGAFDQKFKDFRIEKLSLLKALIYFDDAEGSAEPILIKKMPWEKVKQKIAVEVTNFTSEQSKI